MKYQEIFEFIENNDIVLNGNVLYVPQLNIRIVRERTAHTVNVYDSENNKNFDCFSVGNFSNNGSTWTEFLEGSIQYLKDNYEEEFQWT
jgi:hypothetical protein